MSGVLGKLESFVSAVDQGLEVAQHGVDPDELGQFARLARTHDDVRGGRSPRRTSATAHCSSVP